jgi:hypothetical protein
MTWKNFVSLLAIAPRRRVLATAVMYGLSLTVRFTSATGEEIEIPAQAAQSNNPMTSIMLNDGAQISYKGWLLKSAQPANFHRGWPLVSGDCRAACESPMPMPLMPSCSAP